MENRDRTIAYEPVSCDIVDQIEILATRKKISSVVLGNDKEQYLLTGIIKTWFTKEKVEYLLFSSGIQVRLDKIIEIEGFSVNDTVCKV